MLCNDGGAFMMGENMYGSKQHQAEPIQLRQQKYADSNFTPNWQ
jgi:hypothetical protein